MYDTLGGSPVPYANVAVFADSILEKTSLSDSTGFFTVEISCTEHIVKISHIGYKDLELSTLTLGYRDTVYLSALIEELPEIEVSSKRPEIIHRADRLVFLPNISVKNTALTAYDVLQKTPSLWVGSNGSIRINGKEGARVLINGRLITMPFSQIRSYLEGLNPTLIQRIEVIAIPGAEFEADSKGGVVNIVIDKQLLKGINANFFTGGELGRFPEYSTGVFSNQNLGTVITTANAYLFEQNSFYESLESRTNESGSYYLESDNRSKRTTNNYQVRVGADIFPLKSHISTFEYVITSNRVLGSTAAKSSLLDKNMTSLVNGDYVARSNNLYQSLAFNHKWKLDTLQSDIIFVADYVSNHFFRSGDFSSIYSEAGSQSLNEYLNSFGQESNILSLKLDCNYILTPFSLATLGLKTTVSKVNNLADHFDLIDGRRVVNLNRSINFDFREAINAGYLSYDFPLITNSLNAKLGLRLESALMQGVDQQGLEGFSRSYLDWFPSLHVTHLFGKAKQYSLNMSANRRIQRPTFEALNSFEYVLNEFTLARGNQNLTPEYTSSYELGVRHEDYSVTFNYSRTRDVISNILLNYNGVNIYQDRNLAMSKYFDVTLSMPVAFFGRIKSKFDLSYYVNSFQDDLVAHSLGTYSLRLNWSYLLKKRYQFSGSYVLSSEELDGNLIYDDFQQVDISVGCFFLQDKKLRVSLGARDLFDSQNGNSRMIGTSQEVSVLEKIQTRKVYLYFSYNFSKGNRFSKNNINRSNDSQTARLTN